MAGSSGGASSGGKKKARIEIIPLIDVVFFLLATFILFTLSLNKSNGVHVDLPKVESGERRDPSNSVTISVTTDGALAWEKEPVSLDEFLKRIQAFHLAHPEDAKVLINGDENALFSQAIYVFDEVRKTGIQKVFIETLVKPAGS